MTKFIKSLGLHVDVYICCSPLGYNKRRSWEKKKKKKRDLYLSGNFENVCREMASNTNKWPSPGGCWVSSWVWIQQLVTIFCWLPGCPWALHMETCHYFCHVLGTSGASVPVRAWTKQTKGANCSPRSTMLFLMGDPFFAPPGWGCLGCQWQWCFQPDTGRGWHCSLLLRAESGLSPALAALWLWHHWISIFWRSWDVQGWQRIPWIPCSLPSTGLTAVLLHRRLCSFSSFTEGQRRVQSNLVCSRPRGWVRFTWPRQVKAEVDWKKKICPLTNHPQLVLGWDRWGQTLPTPLRRIRPAQVVQRLACAWKSHPHFLLQMAGDATRIKDKWNILFS